MNALLQLEKLSNLRDTFQKIANAEERSRKECERQKHTTTEQLTQALNIPQLKAEDLLLEVNSRREILGLNEIEKLETNTSLTEGLATFSEGDTKKVVDKKAAENDLMTLQQEIALATSNDVQIALREAVRATRDLSSNKMAWSSISKQNFLNEALNQLNIPECPVCETSWEIDRLKQLIEANISKLDAAVSAKRKVIKNLSRALEIFHTLGQAINLFASYGEKFELEHDTKTLKAIACDIEVHIKEIERFSSVDTVISSLEKLGGCCENLDASCSGVQTKIQTLEEKPDPLAARDFLTVANERLNNWRAASHDLRGREAKAKVARTVFDAYAKTYEDGLNQIYLDVQREFADFYKFVNEEDEGGFSAILAANQSSLDLEVDFYGKGKFPPSAFHSEGHQDGMGFCLYLALMKYIYADEFQVCVLDDILMSVDGLHRRAVCKLIQSKFPNTQFVFTTHDEVWLKCMQTNGIIRPKDFIRFRSWDVETGPHEWKGREVWKEIEDELSKNQVNSAAHKLRYYLEFLFGEVCTNLGAQVVYRGDNQHSLGDLLPQGYSRMKYLLKESRKVAELWEDNDGQRRIESFEDEIANSYQATEVEKWAINSSVHYNTWATLEVADFKPLV